MKKSILVLFIFAVLSSACKKEKDEENTPLTKEELLCQTWNIDRYKLNGHGFAYLTWQFTWKFKTDGSIEWYKIETGELYKTTNWVWAEEQKTLDITIPEWEDKMARCNIVKLTETEMVFEPGDSEHQLEMIFSR